MKLGKQKCVRQFFLQCDFLSLGPTPRRGPGCWQGRAGRELELELGSSGRPRAASGAGGALQQVSVGPQRPELHWVSCLWAGDRVKLYSALRPEMLHHPQPWLNLQILKGFVSL